MPLINRQNLDDDVVVPAHYGGWSPLSPGAVVGVTLGAVVGFLLVLWMFYTCINFGRAPVEPSSSSLYTPTATSVLSVRSRSRHHRKHRSPARGPRIIATEEVRVRERDSLSRTRGGPIIVDADPPMVERRTSRGPPPPRIVTDEEEEVVVIEEHEPERRRRRRHSSSHRHSSRHESRRRSSRDY
ncbi:hypothetical protein CGMCC3_g6017 [Colletotrichum fructicola]|uniref:Uncharacterized protein n=1 Tax=Colletotrichum fructicola (strain Nara gc5) TaxID=1213859 RepID=A0A7J6JGI9_COLFN|nr:uncharacterized protein CGMCC3_g6017 [Colletotrichum fructicola]KAE9578190.1 hypothetical protein CGMCC3_g6017 [Colletotrichum fructicola]KAF4414511.1 hypothetical protein CFRS1_v012027 [Colletotrichum fructicola]KAF4489172.1 hypothetical protein CGGC5_v003969 [Colletotrichum fructicola Nara gc5]KAF5504780.1 hypothetical protein CGCF413_v004812 [Colletotrichum fructicola]